MRINKFGAFNNPGLAISSSSAEVRRTIFESCEVGITVYSNASPLIDSCKFYNSSDWGIRVLSGLPTIQNSLFDNGRFGGLELLDTALIFNNIISNHNFQNYTVGVHINALIHPRFENNVFSSNNYDMLTHPAVVNDTMFDNNGLSNIHIDNLVIGQSTTWHAPIPPENWFYTLTGDVTVDSGDTLQIEGGVSVEIFHYNHDLRVNGTLLANGNKQDSVRFFSTTVRRKNYIGKCRIGITTNILSIR